MKGEKQKRTQNNSFSQTINWKKQESQKFFWAAFSLSLKQIDIAFKGITDTRVVKFFDK